MAGKEFTASNGVEIEVDADGDYMFTRGDEDRWGLRPGGANEAALREFFRQERDAELGRWRWPENPDYVVYTLGSGWLVLDETTGATKHYSHREHVDVGNSLLSQAARAYFAAHPEPTPWHDAKPGEVWELTVEGVTNCYAAILSDSSKGNYIRFFPTDAPHVVTVGATAEVITAGRRIWPEPTDAPTG